MSSATSSADPLVELLRWDGSVLELFRRVSHGTRHPFLLFSGTAPSGQGRWTILGADPFHLWSASGGQESSEDPFECVARLASSYPVVPRQGLPFLGGLVGYLGYECLRYVERVPVRPRENDEPPDAWFGLYGWAVIVDGRSQEAWMVATGWPESNPARRRVRAREDLERLRTRCTTARPGRPTEILASEAPISSLPRARYLGAVSEVLDQIRRGEIYQANVAQRLDLRVGVDDPVGMMERLHQASPAPHAAYLDLGAWRVLSSSPERFLVVDGDRVESRPIKGTAPRGATPEQDAARRRGLRRSAKDRAENLMIVDLVRNDLNRVCRPGTVRVPGLAELETYATLHHLVSTVEGRLRPDRSIADVLRAVFPPGSMTGAPKVRAMEVIHDVEPVRRGPYAGALGYLSFSGRIDLNVMIRTLLLAPGRARFHVGGGVVADSDPAAEYDESLLKARGLLAALGLPPG
jgi:para-aminobenzoate synthetase component I